MNNTVILGAGIVGVSTAYYLSKHQPGSTVHLVEPSPELFASASGKAAGFLAKDWFGADTAELGALSFEEHKKLAETNNGAKKWGYSKSNSYSFSTKEKSSGRIQSRVEAASVLASEVTSVDDANNGTYPPWLKRTDGDIIEVISDQGTTAQVDPLPLCQHLLSECIEAGVHLHHPSKAISILTDVRDELSSICVANSESGTETDIPCTTIVIAAGAWSPRVFAALFPRSGLELPIGSLAGHSLIFKSPRWATGHESGGCHAVFATSSAGYSPEIFSRIGGQIYVAGLNAPGMPLPNLPTDCKTITSSTRELLETARELAGPLDGAPDDLEVIRVGLCFRPISNRGPPIVSRIRDEDLGGSVSTRAGAEGGVYLAAGHGPWGISLSLGTGKVLAEMIQGRKPSADISSLAL